MSLRNKKVLVTGADGFIGSHLVEGLLAEGCSVRAFVYYNSFNSWGWLDTFPKETLKALIDISWRRKGSELGLHFIAVKKDG